MVKLFKRLFLLISFVFLYLIAKEFIQLYTYLNNINDVLAVIVIGLLVVVLFYFGFLPIMQIIFLPPSLGPTKNKEEFPKLLDKRIKKLRGNLYLIKSDFDFTEIGTDAKSYDSIIRELSLECNRIRKKYINRVFYGTAVSQNGFLDAIIILTASVNLVKEIFLLYNGRTNIRDLLIIWKKIYYSIAIGGSEGVEYATEEVFSKLTTESIKSIPFLDKIISSLADGYVNSLLLTRVSLITENYCTKIYIEKDKDLYPSPTFILSTTKDLTNDVMAMIKNNLLKITKEKTESILERAVNPVIHVFEDSINAFKEGKHLEYGKNIVQKFTDSFPFFNKAKK